MAFFRFIYKLILSFGFLGVLLIFSSIITALVYYNHTVKKDIKEFQVTIYEYKEVDSFYSHFDDDTLYIDIRFKSNKKNNYLVAYTFQYVDLYNTTTQLTVLNSNMIIVASNNECYISYASNNVLTTSTILFISSTETYSYLPWQL